MSHLAPPLSADTSVPAGLEATDFDKATEPEPTAAWREELSERVENFRQRRARLRREFDSSTNLELDFEAAGSDPSETAEAATAGKTAEANKELDLILSLPVGTEVHVPLVDSLPLEKAAHTSPDMVWQGIEPGEVPLEQRGTEPEPVEILLESTQPVPAHGLPETAPLVLPTAPLGRRFLAGMADASVLLLGAGLFALILWRAGGRISPQPINLAILSFIAGFFTMAYFGLFTVVASATPGLLWMGIEVRNLDGTLPSLRESLWRAFGYLVSTAALMLGFIWALVDSEGLTWHDRMSGTFLVLVEPKRFR